MVIFFSRAAHGNRYANDILKSQKIDRDSVTPISRKLNKIENYMLDADVAQKIFWGAGIASLITAAVLYKINPEPRMPLQASLGLAMGSAIIACVSWVDVKCKINKLDKAAEKEVQGLPLKLKQGVGRVVSQNLKVIEKPLQKTCVGRALLGLQQ